MNTETTLHQIKENISMCRTKKEAYRMGVTTGITVALLDASILVKPISKKASKQILDLLGRLYDRDDPPSD